jgi:hypothetical protein
LKPVQIYKDNCKNSENGITSEFEFSRAKDKSLETVDIPRNYSQGAETAFRDPAINPILFQTYLSGVPHRICRVSMK